MNHLFNISVYHSPEDIAKAKTFCSGDRADGMELLTGYEPVNPSFKAYVGSVHLPYAVDWYSPAIGRLDEDFDLPPNQFRYRHYGHDRKEIADSIYRAIECAAPLEPAYGVLHAGCANIKELLLYDYSDKDDDVIDMFAELVNDAVSRFPGGEPPFTLAFENTWWPGLRMIDNSGYKRLEKKIEFFDWGICLDTGHLMFAMKGADDEKGVLETLNKVADSYSDGLLSRLITMHLHLNTSASILRNMTDPKSASYPTEERIAKAYPLIGSVDQHRPFTDPAIKEYVERLEPDCIVHEMGAVNIGEQIRDHILQRSLFD